METILYLNLKQISALYPKMVLLGAWSKVKQAYDSNKIAKKVIWNNKNIGNTGNTIV